MLNWSKKWGALWHPERYHGWGKQRNYFEGWYIKLVSPREDCALALIPGISMGADGQQHAFVQLLDGKECSSAYHRFPAAEFEPDAHRFKLKLGANTFGSEGLSVQLPELQGTLAFENSTPWPASLGAPGVMGWYSFVPFMECYHGVVSLHHRLSGRLRFKEREVDFTGGIGYIEKDWGQSFPSSWIWMQSNHFTGAEKACLMVSVARIPWLGSHFVGFLAGFQLGGMLHRFTTYNGSSVKVNLREAQREVRLHINRGEWQLEITARQRGGSGALVSPIAGAMAGKVNESLQSVCLVRLIRGREVLYDGEGRHAGLEIAGPVQKELLA